VRLAPCSVSVRGHGQKSVKVVADSVLLEVEAVASDNHSKTANTCLRPEWRK
jgi:hypothetical protein